MSNPRDVSAILDRDFLELRGRILELAAAFDRLDRASTGDAVDGPPADPRIDQLRQGLKTVLERDSNRAEAVQRLFSLAYDPRWLEQAKLR